MTDFCPDGYLPTRDALVRAAQSWFPDKIAALEPTAARETQTEPKNDLEAAVRIFSQPHVPDARQQAFEEIASQTVHRLRNVLHQNTLKAYYFESDGRHTVPCNFWPTSKADNVLESGIFWPFGKSNARHERRPSHPLFVKLSELDALLTEQLAKKRPFPKAKISDLIAALRKLEHLPNRNKQRETLRKLPEFAQYHLTEDVFRQAEKQVPREPGRKRLSPEA